MLSTLLGQLQTSFSKYFLLGSFFPVLAFAFLNGLIAYFLFSEWRYWVDQNVLNPSLGSGAFFTASAGLAIILVAYVVSSLNTTLRRTLEGRNWGQAAKLFIPTQSRVREDMLLAFNQAAADRADLAEAPQWIRKMAEARQRGRKLTDTSNSLPDTLNKISDQIQKLDKMRKEYRWENDFAEDVRQAVEELTTAFALFNVDSNPQLDRSHGLLLLVIKYAEDRTIARQVRIQNQLNSSFGIQEIAPTKMGNIANTIQSYSLRRYNCNLEQIWSNMQRLIEKDNNAYTALQEAKTQLDFLVACFWLTILSSLTWMPIMIWYVQSRGWFLKVAIGGPLISYVIYRMAAEQYRSFADVTMSTLDLFRLDLLRTFRLRLPGDVVDERDVWENYDKLATYGASSNFRYEHPKE
jgi:hypothetical protein